MVNPFAPVALSLAVCAAATPAAAAPLRSGFYEGFVLAVSPAGRVTGHFDMTQGEGVTKRCAFDFTGQATGAGAVIRGAGLTGRLASPSADEVSFSMARVRALPGCDSVLPPEIETAAGFELDRIRPGNWSELARIKGARVALRASPDAPSGRAYLIKGDTVGVLARRGGQVQIVYPSERQVWSQGWVAAADLVAL